MKNRTAILCLLIALDAVGIGLIYPILPDLLRGLAGTRDVGVLYGLILALYAFMQFVWSPVLGALSDRFGRRPILLMSIAGATIDYVVMARSTSLGTLLVGRAIAGATSANLAVAMAYITDVTEEESRVAQIGYLQAAFGAGFFLGPVLGGVMGTTSVRAPFFAAALLNVITFALAYAGLPESRPGSGRLAWTTFNPLSHIRWAVSVKSLVPLLGLHLVIGLVGNLSSTIWVLYGHDRFLWDARLTGASLALLGLCHAITQGGLAGPITERVGERAAVYAGIACDVLAMVWLGSATHGWLAFALAPLFSLGGIGLPALQSMTTRQVGEAHHGELQGVLASIGSLTATAGPLIASTAYAATKAWWLGSVWVLFAALYALCLPLMLAVPRPCGSPPTPTARTGTIA